MELEGSTQAYELPHRFAIDGEEAVERLRARAHRLAPYGCAYEAVEDLADHARLHAEAAHQYLEEAKDSDEDLICVLLGFFIYGES